MPWFGGFSLPRRMYRSDLDIWGVSTRLLQRQYVIFLPPVNSTWQANYNPIVSTTFAQLFYCGDMGQSSPAPEVNNFCCSASQGSLTDCCKSNFSFPGPAPSGGDFTGKAFIPDTVDKENVIASTTASAQSNVAASATGTSTATVSSTDQSVKSSTDGVSPGAVAGAAIGALIGGVLIGIAGACVFFTRKI